MKKSAQLNLRLSYQAHSHLSDITSITGMTKTAAVEYSLALMRSNLYYSGKDLNMSNTYRTDLDNRLATLNLGDISDTYHLTDDQLKSLIVDLENAKEQGKLDLETSQGVDLLETIWNAHNHTLVIDQTEKETNMTNTIVNEYGYEMDYDAAVNMMDDDLRKAIYNWITEPITPQQFFDTYRKEHYKKFGEVFELAKPNPVW